MFYFVKGTYEGVFLDHVVVAVGGFGMKLQVPENSPLPKKGEEITLFTEMVVGEGFCNLYGFLTEDELKLFNLLTGKVPSVGPKSALSILSTLSPRELLLAVTMSDGKIISRAKGIGPKAAERIILELKDRIDLFDAGVAISEEQIQPKEKIMTADNDVLEALMALGYSRQEFYGIATKLDKTLSLDQQIKRALFLLSIKK